MSSSDAAPAKAGKRSHKEITPSEDVAEAAPVERAVVLGPIAAIAHPRASERLEKKAFKAVKKAAAAKHLRRGVKETVKAVRKGDKGFVAWTKAVTANTSALPRVCSVMVLAADISPYDVISHIPVMCEDAGIPYVFVQSKSALGAASSTKRPTSVVLVVTAGKTGAVPAYDGDDKVAALVADAKELGKEHIAAA